MKKVMSISLGSSKRNKKLLARLGRQDFQVWRVGVDGNVSEALALLRRFSGQVDAFGLGGMDMHIYAGQRRYTFREAAQFITAAGRTPLLDGSGLKNTLERQVVDQLSRDGVVDFRRSRVLLMCGVDRFGMAEAIAKYDGQMILGDLMFGLMLPLPLRKLSQLNALAQLLLPVLTKLPVKFLYPTGRRQEQRRPMFTRYFKWADVIAGDFHFIRRYMPDCLSGKTVITNTITADDRRLLETGGVKTLVTTTPDFGGRSFGTNVIEAMLTAYRDGQSPVTTADYEELIAEAGLKPGIIHLN